MTTRTTRRLRSAPVSTSAWEPGTAPAVTAVDKFVVNFNNSTHNDVFDFEPNGVFLTTPLA